MLLKEKANSSDKLDKITRYMKNMEISIQK